MQQSTIRQKGSLEILYFKAPAQEASDSSSRGVNDLRTDSGPSKRVIRFLEKSLVSKKIRTYATQLRRKSIMIYPCRAILEIPWINLTASSAVK
jgi:hypothetical protein